MQFLINTFQWLTLVIPAILIALISRKCVARWFRKTFWHQFAAWFSGLILIGFSGFLLLFFLVEIFDHYLAKCQSTKNYYLCAEHTYLLGYPVIIFLIAFGIFFFTFPLWRITKIFISTS